ncbi:MAG: tRNA-intron lyase [Thermoprotei archaeon]|nr:MAG: tRNA-intron lyase [Thermoprotei archaeon]RLF19842.1 MAG: tRNA-intron lyase [Thermoprotei archaeon]
MRNKIAKAYLEEGRVVIKDDKWINELHYNKHYGRLDGNELVLHPVEALYLMHIGKLEVYEGEKKLSFEELTRRFSKTDSKLWMRFLVYCDLRRRGLIAVPLKGRNVSFLLYGRGANVEYNATKYLVYAVCEGVRVDFKELARIAEEARRSKKEVVLAVMDRQGEIAYYSMSTISL